MGSKKPPSPPFASPADAAPTTETGYRPPKKDTLTTPPPEDNVPAKNAETNGDIPAR